ncbi:TIGR03758 family integrating conjugative element protein [Vreelandella nigrificans]|uniref:TIGR03758 family integrating conjugative element protein n=1 Tax=Vreelandella nigrificans TaxID=2042704 RepID=A0A2A4HI26_9GAMM|nr:TIGR03758 family integrating conjugative element protein [Halomonas nigrificans]PCF94077.1 TIGR03758 family integrating conjugative element protein [Halomonas nigrificans]
MSAESASAFQTAAGFDGTTIFLMLSGTGCVVAILWAMWTAMSAYKGWVNERVDDNTFVYACLRVVLLLIIFYWVFLPSG